MTKEEFYDLKIGDKVFDVELGEEGVIEVLGRGEVYVSYPHDSYTIYSYDINDDPECYLSLKKV